MKSQVLQLVLIASVYSQKCYFDDSLLRSDGDDSGTESAIFERAHSAKWDDHDNRIPYFFTRNVPYTDRNVMRQQMDRIAQKTCIKFREIKFGRKPRHVLRIQSKYTNERCQAGQVSWGYNRYSEVVLTLFGRGCGKGLMMHELGHVLGLAHTQMRPDRDCHVNINWGCIKPKYYSQFKRLSCRDGNTHGTPYMCNSIMHYHDTAFSKYYSCKSITPKNGLKCKNGSMGKLGYPLPEDWDLIERAHCRKGTSSIKKCRTCRP